MPRGGPRVNSGGARPGAGRKPGSTGIPEKRTSKTTELAEKAAAAGPLPLQILLDVMRAYYAAGEYAKAAAVARDAAPYQHPRKQSVTVEGGASPVEIKLVRDTDFYANAHRLPAEGA